MNCKCEKKKFLITSSVTSDSLGLASIGEKVMGRLSNKTSSAILLHSAVRF